MQTSRMIEIVYLLLNKKNITANELSKYFQVSVRTIYRDIDNLSAMGIPIYRYKGKGGGIRLTDKIFLNKYKLSDKEQQNILSALQRLGHDSDENFAIRKSKSFMNPVDDFVVNNPKNSKHKHPDVLASLQELQEDKYSDVNFIVQKIKGFFHTVAPEWIEVDFSDWRDDPVQKKNIQLIKSAVLEKHAISFIYFSSYGEKTKRVIEPLKMVLKGQEWYVYAFCPKKNADRLFKISRMRQIEVLGETFDRKAPTEVFSMPDASASHKMVTVQLKVDACMSYRIYDEFSENQIVKNDDGSFLVTADFPEGESIFGYLLSFGNYAKVLSPKKLQNAIASRLEKSLELYSECK